jgi:hypothetical protein
MVLVWNADGRPAPAAAPVEAPSTEAVWGDLASEDVPTAYRAMRRVAPKDLLERLLPPVDEARIAKLVEGLKAEFLDEREKSAAELADLAWHPAAWKGLEGEALQARVAAQEDPLLASPLLLRRSRAVQALASAGAREALDELASKAPQARQTREAKAALARLKEGPR